MRRSHWILPLLMVCLGVSAVRDGAAQGTTPTYKFERILSFGDKLSDTELVDDDGDFEVGGFNSTGSFPFVTQVSDGSARVGEGAYLWTRQGIIRLARTGLPTPGGGTFGATLWSPVSINDANNVTIATEVESGGETSTSVYFYDARANQFTPVLTRGLPTPSGGEFAGAERFSAINNRNEIAFSGIVKGNDHGGIYLWSNGTITAVAPVGTTMPGGGKLTQGFRVDINDHAAIAFEGAVDGNSVYGAYLAQGGNIIAVATPDQDVPGGGGKLQTITGPHPDNNGNVVLLGQVGDDWGVFLYTAGKLVTIARPGDALPGGGTFTTSANFRHETDINDSGTVVFAGQFDGGGGVYLFKDGKLSVVARTGQELAGIGKVEGIARVYPSSIGVAINSSGQVLFPALVAGKESLIVATPQ
jgi:hypothetical protein